MYLLSIIIEGKCPRERLTAVLKALQQVQHTVDTVFSVGLIMRPMLTASFAVPRLCVASVSDQGRQRRGNSSEGQDLHRSRRGLPLCELGRRQGGSALELSPAEIKAQLTDKSRINFSLGVWGKKNLLPPDEVLAVTTMCGHHMMSPRIVEQMVEDITENRISAAEAGETLGRLCLCGVFNQVRASEELDKMVRGWAPGRSS